jgi:hypothetical protein
MIIMARRKTSAYTENQYARVKVALAQRTPNPSVGLSSLENMGGRKGIIANRYARATGAYMRRRTASRGMSNG